MVEHIPTQDMLVVMDDLDARIGNAGLNRSMAKHGCGKTNEIGERQDEFVLILTL